MLNSQLLVPANIALKEKRHADVVVLSTQALSASKHSTQTKVAALDLRCQAYAKLGRFHLALQDAKHIIRESSRQAPEGYLRCSQIEKLSGNYSAAIRWLEHGSKQVPQHRRLFQTHIHKVQAVANKHVMLRHRRDPVLTVPLEVLTIIFSYLPYREMVCLLRVSRTWKTLLSKLPPLSTEIDFSDAKKKISVIACRAAYQRLGARHRRIVVDSLLPSSLKSMESWLTRYANAETTETLHLLDKEISLNSVMLKRFNRLKCLYLGRQRKVHDWDVFDLIATCQTLQEVVAYAFTNTHTATDWNNLRQQTQLQHLHLESIYASAIPPECFQNFPNLQTLSVIGLGLQHANLNLRNLRQMRELRLALKCPALVRISLPPSIEVFCCGPSLGVAIPCFYAIMEPVHLPRLRSMTVDSYWGMAFIRALSKCNGPPTVEEANLTNMRDFYESAYQGSTAFHNCRKLAIECHSIKDSNSGFFATLFPKVEKLVMKLPQITGVFVSDLVEADGCCLTEVTLQDCIKVSHDVQEWLRSRNIGCQMITTPIDTRPLDRLRNY